MAVDTAPHSANSAEPHSSSGSTELAEVSAEPRSANSPKPDGLSPTKHDGLSPPKPGGLSPPKPEPGEPAVALNIAVLTVSDTRTRDNDTSGDFLADAVAEAGHKLADRALIADDVYRIRALLSQWIASEQVQVALVTGGTGFSGRDSTPEAVRPLLDKHIDGFGEVFRSLSLREIGSSTLQSRACAGLANRTAVFCMPGSTGACRTAWQGILRDQLDSRHRPCNFVAVLQGRGPHSANSAEPFTPTTAPRDRAPGQARDSLQAGSATRAAEP